MAPESASNKIGKTVGERLRAARIAQKITQGQLAAPDFSVSYISAIERGQIHPSLRALEILSMRLGLSSTQLLPNRAQQDELDQAHASQPEREEDGHALTLLEIQLLLYQGESQAALRLLETLPLKKLKQLQQLQYRYFTGWAHFIAESVPESEQAFLEARQLATDMGEHYFIIRILNFLGIIYSKTHDYQQALVFHEQCLKLLQSEETPDILFIVQVYSYMGQHYADQEDMDQALENFALSHKHEATLASPQDVQRFYLKQCTAFTTAKAYETAAVCAYKSSYIHADQTRRNVRAVLYHQLGEALIQENPQRAESYLDKTIHSEVIQQDALAQGSLFLHKAKLYAARHEYVQALDCAKQAYALAQSHTQSAITAEILLTLGRIEYSLDHYDEGDQHFVAGLELLERIGTQEELADQSVHYAQLLEGRGKAREAFNYFRRAFQSSQRAK